VVQQGRVQALPALPVSPAALAAPLFWLPAGASSLASELPAAALVLLWVRAVLELAEPVPQAAVTVSF
jgi:hypothetical protein